MSDTFQSEVWRSTVRRAMHGQLANLGYPPVPVTVFRRSLLNIALTRWPMGTIGTEAMRCLPDGELYIETRRADIDLLRTTAPAHLIPQSAGRNLHVGSRRPETRIEELGSWSLDQLSPAVRRNVRKVSECGVDIDPATAMDAAAMFAIYRQTIVRNGGKLRYPERWFHELAQASRTSAGIHLYRAFHEKTLVGFMAVIDADDTAHYLHGGVNRLHSSTRAMDGLFAEAIGEARDRGMRVFNFSSSPPDQHGLVRYKEKWGGSTTDHVTFTTATSYRGSAALAFLGAFRQL